MAGSAPGGREAFLACCQSSPRGHRGEPLFPILWQDFPVCSGVFNRFPFQRRATMRLNISSLFRGRDPQFSWETAGRYVRQKASGSQVTGVLEKLPVCSSAGTGTQPLFLWLPEPAQAEHCLWRRKESILLLSLLPHRTWTFKQDRWPADVLSSDGDAAVWPIRRRPENVGLMCFVQLLEQ